MSQCKHTHILVIRESSLRLRCRHCHLTIKPEDITDGFCPECYEADGRKRDDFERIESALKSSVRYRCEECGVMLGRASFNPGA